MVVDELTIEITGEGVKSLTDSIKTLADSLKKVTTPSAKTNEEVKKVGKSASKSAVGVGKLVSSLLKMAKVRLLRAVIRSIISAFSEGLQNVYQYEKAIGGGNIQQSMDSLATAAQTMKNQLGSAFGELLSLVIPYVNKIAEAITWLADKLTQLFAALGGNKTYNKAVSNAKEWAEAASSGAAAAQEWKNQLMGFDEINRLDSPDSGSSGSGSSSSDDYGSMFETVDTDSWAQTISDALAAIELAAGAFMLGLGLILTLSGTNIPLGLGLMAGGVALIASAAQEDWEYIPSNVSQLLGEIGIIAGAALLALGCILLAVPGQMGLALGCIAAGIVSIGAVALSWDKLPQDVRSTLLKVAGIAAGAMLAIGLVLTLCGLPGMGVPMMIAGGLLGLGTAAVAIDWDALHQKVDEGLENLKEKWNTFWDRIKEVVALSKENIKEKFEDLKQGIKDIWDGIVDTIKGAINKVFADVESWINGIIDGINGMLASVAAAASSLTGQTITLSISHVTLPRLATGGLVDKATPAIIGEDGAEAVIPLENNTGALDMIADKIIDAMGRTGDRAVKVYLDSREIRAGLNRTNRALGVS